MRTSLRLEFNDGCFTAVSFPDDITEDLPLTHLEGNQHRVEFSSLLADPRVFWGDVIEINPTGDKSADFVRVVKLSGFRVYCRIIRPETIESPLFQGFLETIMQLGGNWERAFGGVLMVHLPADTEFDLERELQTLTRVP